MLARHRDIVVVRIVARVQYSLDAGEGQADLPEGVRRIVGVVAFADDAGGRRDHAGRRHGGAARIGDNRALDTALAAQRALAGARAISWTRPLSSSPRWPHWLSVGHPLFVQGRSCPLDRLYELWRCVAVEAQQTLGTRRAASSTPCHAEIADAPRTQ